jgi:hypothetical protein
VQAAEELVASENKRLAEKESGVWISSQVGAYWAFYWAFYGPYFYGAFYWEFFGW